MMFAQDLTNPLLLLAVILFLGTLLGEGAERLSAPWIIGSILAGVVLGPEALGLLSSPQLTNLSGFSQTSLAVIAFCIGSRLTLERLRAMGASVVLLAIAQILAPLVVVFGAEASIGMRWQTALIVAAAAPATAPTITYAVFRRRNASGPFVDRAFGILAINDAATVLLFSVVSAATVAALGAHGSNAGVRASIEIAALNEVGSLLAGGAVGGLFLIARSAISDKSPGCADRLRALLYSLLLLAVGMAAALGLSQLLTPLAMGFVIANGSSDEDRAMVQGAIFDIEEPLYIIFFVLAGAHLPIDDATNLFVLLAAAVYVLARFAGKYAAISAAARALRLDARDAKISRAVLPLAGRAGHGPHTRLRRVADGARSAALRLANSGDGDFRRLDGRAAVAALRAARHRLCGAAGLLWRDAGIGRAPIARRKNHSGVTRVTWPILRPGRISRLP